MIKKVYKESKRKSKDFFAKWLGFTTKYNTAGDEIVYYCRNKQEARENKEAIENVCKTIGLSYYFKRDLKSWMIFKIYINK